MKPLQHRLEFALAWPLFAFFRLLPLDTASAMGSALGRMIGPHLGAHRTAIQNLTFAFPDKNESEIRAIALGMWDNLGRIITEYPFLPGPQLASRMIVSGAENLPKPGRQPWRPVA